MVENPSEFRCNLYIEMFLLRCCTTSLYLPRFRLLRHSKTLVVHDGDGISYISYLISTVSYLSFPHAGFNAFYALGRQHKVSFCYHRKVLYRQISRFKFHTVSCLAHQRFNSKTLPGRDEVTPR